MGRSAGSWWDLKDLAPHLSVASQMDPMDVPGGQTSVNPPPPQTLNELSVGSTTGTVCVHLERGRRHTRAHANTRTQTKSSRQSWYEGIKSSTDVADSRRERAGRRGERTREGVQHSNHLHSSPWQLPH